MMGNQLANALKIAGVVQPEELDRTDERAILDDVRQMLVRVASTPAVVVKPKGLYLDIVRRLRMRGLVRARQIDPRRVELTRTDSLMALAAQPIRDEVLREWAMTEPAPELAPEEETDVEEMTMAEDPVARPMRAMSKVARDAWVIERALAWLKSGADGSTLLVKHMLDGQHLAYGRAARLREAGIIEGAGEGMNRRYRVCEGARDAVLTMTPEDLATIFADRRKPGAVEWEAGSEPLDEEAMNEAQSVAMNGAPDPVPAGGSVPVEILTQIAAALERLDARFARLEKELGLPPLETP